MKGIPRSVYIESLVKLREKISHENLPEEIEKQALKENPWFTSYYLKKALDGIREWLDMKELRMFVEAYPYSTNIQQAKTIGVIAAGNVPMVGFHDLLCGILSGHKVSIKYSHQDRTMMDWLISEWKKILPELKNYISVSEKLENIDFLIATGSNNTARYFEANFRSTPKIIRKNRYSVAIIDKYTTDSELVALCEDMMLYNGLGCRNVSNLILLDGVKLDRLRKKLKEYPISRVNSYYLERILFENTRKGVITKEFITSTFGLFFVGRKLKPLDMGYFQVIPMKDEKEAKTAISLQREEIQVVVGDQVPFGAAQKPRLSDFADGVDTMKILTEL